MPAETYVYLAVFLLWLLAAIQGAWALWGGLRFYHYVTTALASGRSLHDERGRFRYQPKAAVILPCCGVDEKLRETVEALRRQNYVDYQVIFTFESAEDPAYQAVGRWIEGWNSPSAGRVIAESAQGRSQKVHNLLAAVAEVAADREVLVFLDSDAVPGQDWLGHMVAPLQDPTVGVATGYRWYTATGGLAAGARCAWNAATVTLLDDERVNFCWGGATAILRRTFEAIDVPGRWSGSLTDDYPITLAARAAGLRIRFVPQALVPSSDRTTLRDFCVFARRQLVITRVYVPRIWWAGFTLCLNFVVGGTATAALFFAAALDWLGGDKVMLAALAGWLSILALAIGKALLRQLAVRKILRPPDWTWRDFCWDVGGVSFSGLLHLGLLLASLSSRRFVWRHTLYELVSPDETRVLGRVQDRSQLSG
jgi:cellulose synthase/poly-beta-1,6-N-acetylglucosamine synthase-like glycosyltransferase